MTRICTTKGCTSFIVPYEDWPIEVPGDRSVYSGAPGLAKFNCTAALGKRVSHFFPQPPAGPPQDARGRIIYYLPDALKMEGEKILRDASNKAGGALTEIANLARDEKEMMSMFSFAIPSLIKWGVIKNLTALGTDIGKRLIDLMKMANGGLGMVIHGVISKLVDSKVITAKDISIALKEKAGWLTDLSKAAGNTNPATRWQALHFGIGNLLKAGLVQREKLDEIFRYEEGSALYEMARASWIVDMPQDYFGAMLGDWLNTHKGDSPDAKTIGKFIRETAGPAQEFYKAGDRQRKEINSKDEPPTWKSVLERYSDILPLDDIPKILPLLTKALENPLDMGLAGYISERQGYNIMGAETIEDLRRALDYVSFLEWLTQKGGLRQNWLDEKVSLFLLANKFKDKDPGSIFDVAMVLNSFVGGFGDGWVKKSAFPVPEWKGVGRPVVVPISFSTFQQVYKKFYLIRLLSPNDISGGRYKLVWQNGLAKTVAVGELADVILMYNWLTDMLGSDGAHRVLGNFDGEGLKVDIRNFPERLTRLGIIHSARTKYNEQSTGNEQLGDTFIRCLSRAIVQASVVSGDDSRLTARGDIVSIDTMVRILKGWSDASHARISRDMRGTYDSYMSEFAAKIQSYFDENRDEFEKRADCEDVRALLKQMERPLWLDRPKDANDGLRELLRQR